MNKKRKIVIVSPRQANGGPIVLHLMCKLLQEKGYDAKMFFNFNYGRDSKISKSTFWYNWARDMIRDTKYLIKGRLSRYSRFKNIQVPNGYSYMPVRGYKRKFTPFISKDTIVVYPEIIYGNFLNAKNVVRWMLYFYPYKDDKNAYDEKDLFICFREHFNDFDLNPSCRKVKLNNFDKELYRQTNFDERNGVCYMLRKGKERADLPATFDGPVLDNMTEEDIVKAFNQYKFCYFYDTQTFYSYIAAICGCIPVVVCEPGKTKSDYLSNGDKSYGIAYGDSDEEIEYAVKTRNEVIDFVKEFDKKNNENIDYFIDEIEKYFNN